MKVKGLTGCIVALFLCLVSSLAAVAAEEGFTPLFDGKTLKGWSGLDDLWSVRDGAIVGSTLPNGRKGNTFLVYEKPFDDFVLRFEYKFTGGNSGVQFRSADADNCPAYMSVKGCIGVSATAAFAEG